MFNDPINAPIDDCKFYFMPMELYREFTPYLIPLHNNPYYIWNALSPAAWDMDSHFDYIREGDMYQKIMREHGEEGINRLREDYRKHFSDGGYTGDMGTGTYNMYCVYTNVNKDWLENSLKCFYGPTLDPDVKASREKRQKWVIQDIKEHIEK